MSFLYDWDTDFEAQPASTDDYHLVGLEIRTTKHAFRERFERCHRIGEGTLDGSHEQVTLRLQATNPTLYVSGAVACMKNVGGSGELHILTSLNSGEVPVAGVLSGVLATPLTRMGCVNRSFMVQAQTLATHTGTGTISFSGEIVDTYNAYSPATKTFTAPFDGVFLFNVLSPGPSLTNATFYFKNTMGGTSLSSSSLATMASLVVYMKQAETAYFTGVSAASTFPSGTFLTVALLRRLS